MDGDAQDEEVPDLLVYLLPAEGDGSGCAEEVGEGGGGRYCGCEEGFVEGCLLDQVG